MRLISKEIAYLEDWIEKMAPCISMQLKDEFYNNNANDFKWRKSNNENNIIEYSMCDISDVKKMLDEYLPEEYFAEIKNVLCVAILKGNMSYSDDAHIHMEAESKNNMSLPDYIYVF